jgi:organic hydroperoxide reductase OsmC/OhrA
MNKEHHYSLNVAWTGNTGTGTTSYRTYERSHIISAENKSIILASSDKAFRGDTSMYCPEELLVASISSCHMLWFLHLCSDHGIIVTDYTDSPEGIMIETSDGGGRFHEVILKPAVTVIEDSMISNLDRLHEKAHELCFIANSVNFTITLKSTVKSK